MKKILVLPMYGIGDALMTTPALRNLKEQMDAEVTYLHMFKTTHDILMQNPYADRHIYFPFLEASKLSGLRFFLRFRGKYDYSINFYPSNRRQYNIAAYAVGSSVRIGHRYIRRDYRELNFLKNRTIREDDALHNVEENLRLLNFLHIRDAKPYPLELYLTEDEKTFARQWLRVKGIGENRIIAIHPGASTFKNHAAKRWPETSYAELINRISGELEGCTFILFGGPEEEALKGKIMSLVNNPKNVLSTDKLSIREAAALMERCNLFVGNDAGPMHMAAALGIPSVAVFGPTNPVWVGPWRVRHRIVRLGLPCSPCFRYSPTPMVCQAKADYACIREIGTEPVLKACLELLDGMKN